MVALKMSKGSSKSVGQHDGLNALDDQNPRATFRKLSTELQICCTTISQCLGRMEKTKKMDRFVSHQDNEIETPRVSPCFLD